MEKTEPQGTQNAVSRKLITAPCSLRFAHKKNFRLTGDFNASSPQNKSIIQSEFCKKMGLEVNCKTRNDIVHILLILTERFASCKKY